VHPSPSKRFASSQGSPTLRRPLPQRSSRVPGLEV
jgi:hypothetical protein